MQTLPDGRLDLLTFFESRIEVWSQAAEAGTIGISPEQALDLAEHLEEARAAWDHAQLARQAAEAATLASNSAIAKLRFKGASLVGVIKLHAEWTGNRDVYGAARLNPPAPRRMRLPAPPAPEWASRSTELVPGGSVRLRWEPQGTREEGGGHGPTTGVYFEVFAITTTGRSVLLGATAEPFLEIPLKRVEGVSVTVRAVRGNRRSAPAPTITVADGRESPVRIAA
ncbi:MAG: hypothetical protein HEQ23_16580 [Tepidisphaera sp.]